MKLKLRGRPVIAYGKGGAREIVIDNETGYLFEEQSISSLKEKILLMEKNYKNFDSEKIQKNSKRFDVKMFEKNVLDLVNNIVNKG